MEIRIGVGVEDVKFGMNQSEVIAILGKEFTKDNVDYSETHKAFILEYNSLELYFYFDSKDDYKLTGFSSHSKEHTLSGLTLIGHSKKEVILSLSRRGINDLIIEDRADLEDLIDMNYMPDEILNSDKSGLSLWFVGDKLTKIQSAKIEEETKKNSNHSNKSKATFLKKHYKNLIFVVIILVLFLTPLGFHLKVFIHQYINFSPSEIAIEEQVTLNNYNWQLTDGNGAEIDFKEFKNKVVVINFWATWCPPCVAEMPSFQKLYDSYKEEVVFLFVANDKPEKVNQFINENDFNFINYYENSSTPAELVSSSIPATFIISKKGKIVMTKKGAADWNSENVRSLLEKLIK